MGTWWTKILSEWLKLPAYLYMHDMIAVFSQERWDCPSGACPVQTILVNCISFVRKNFMQLSNICSYQYFIFRWCDMLLTDPPMLVVSTSPVHIHLLITYSISLYLSQSCVCLQVFTLTCHIGNHFSFVRFSGPLLSQDITLCLHLPKYWLEHNIVGGIFMRDFVSSRNIKMSDQVISFFVHLKQWLNLNCLFAHRVYCTYQWSHWWLSG